MGVSAETRPVQLPLPGGREGATVRLRPLLTGEMRAPPGLLERPAGRFARARTFNPRGRRQTWVWVPIPAFLIEHPGAGAVVVDTGLHPSVCVDPRQSFGRFLGQPGGFRMEPEQAVPEQLRARGVDPGEVGVVVMTHMHYDHTSGVSELPGATFLVDRREWDSATAPRGFLRGYRPAHFDYGFDWRTIDYEAPAVESFASFAHSVDLFGDGSIRLVSTPGHTAGHQSLVLRLHEREALLTGDALYERRAIDRDVRPLLMADEHRYWRSVREIRRYLERTPGTVVITGHDRVEWPKLQPVYE